MISRPLPTSKQPEVNEINALLSVFNAWSLNKEGLPSLLKPEATAFGSQCPERFGRGEAGTEARTTPLTGIDRGLEMGTGGRSQGAREIIDTSTK